MKKILIIVILIAIAAAAWLYFIKGYISIRVRHPVPESLIYEAEIPGMKDIRFMIDPMKLKHSKLRELIYGSGLTRAKFLNREINILAISGGGANGAYGAGVLCGWSEAGTRPQFDIVTGVSTGALTAPAAFIGPSYDSVIREIYTNISDADIAKQNFIDFLFEGRPSLLDTQPLREVLKGAVTKKLIDDVAAAHAKGRRLYIVTANLDAKRLVVWDMGAIASYGTPEALELFRNVMLASAAIPVAFPPIMFDVEARGRMYDEMHVDGSVGTQIFGSLIIFTYDEIKTKKTNAYVLRNGKLADEPEAVSPKVWNIAQAAFSMFIMWQSYGDIYRFSTLAKYDRIRFYFTCIPYEFNEPRTGEFDLSYMRKLFYRGYRLANSGGAWTSEVGDRIRESVGGGK